MIGERLGWFQLAALLHTPVSELQQRISSTEFTEWMIYIRKERTFRTKDEYYFARIASELRRSWVANPEAVQEENFLIPFVEDPVDQKMVKSDVGVSKRFWMGLCGAKGS